uniref:BRCA1-associated protein n=1 Tax=Strigamia maritima TaxID=126957 RepID=T1J2K9_STRMM
MSVSLCVFRLEIARDYSSLNHIHYIAPKLRNMSEKHGAVSTQFSKNTPELEKIHRGRRHLHDITIETFTRTDPNSANSAASSRPSSKEASPVADVKNEKKQKFVNQVNFFSGNPFVEVTKGILHLYKENKMTSLNDDVPRSEMLCMLSVPAAMTSHDLLQFTAPCSPDVEHMRIIRDSTPNQYMVLIKFRSQEGADEFYKAFNGMRFNSIEPEVCHLVYVAKVETTKETEAGCLPMEGHTELPTCPVCLERMDESVDGILTILCNHSFHGSCLSKWGDTSCPVCRYCQTPEAVADNRCFQCHSQESLWICLICGHVGCGRYVEGHAYNHFQETQHTYAMQLGNNRVWDYAGDNYVHRLVQNKTDGKLVELNERSMVVQDEKVDSIQLEYTYLLTSQLESQRAYFEERISRFEKEAHMQVEEIKERARITVDECKNLQDKLQSVAQEKSNNDKKLQQLLAKFTKTAKELKEEKEMNNCLMKNQQEWQIKVKELEKELAVVRDTKDKEIEELREQLRDIMIHLNAQHQLQQAEEVSQDDIEGGTISVGAAATPSSSHTSHRHLM